jgi:molecular chaperone DnaK
VEVTFDIDANGILNVKAQDKATGKEQKITITATSGLSKEEVEKMRTEAESHADEDKKKKELIEIRNSADSLVYTAEKTLKDAGSKVKPEDKTAVEDKIKTVREKLTSENLEEIKKATDDLSQAIQKVGAAMYQNTNTQSQQTPPGAKTEEKKEENPENKQANKKEENKQEK